MDWLTVVAAATLLADDVSTVWALVKAAKADAMRAVLRCILG